MGKEWRSVFTFQDNMKGLSWTPVEVFWRVKEYDQVEVPAGKFRAFLIESKPSINWGIRREQVWYAPEVQQLIKRVGHMNDLANALVFLCSDEASFITAQTLPVDGGLVRIP